MLIKCPECGKEISDKCAQCIHCGYPLIKTKTESNTNKLTNSPCPVCGNTDHILNDSHSEECPCCGYIFRMNLKNREVHVSKLILQNVPPAVA